MGPTNILIQRLGDRGHPLGQGISQGEVPILLEALRHRLDASVEEFDVSPDSLKRLEKHLGAYQSNLQKANQPLSDDDLMKLVREVAAYIGEVLVKHAGAQWGRETLGLWGTEVVVEGPWKVSKNGRRYLSPYPTHFILGSEAAWAWDMLAAGKSPNLFRIYTEARNKSIRERLK